jgi:two-component system, chemotaxis family, sensor kinase CheA
MEEFKKKFVVEALDLLAELEDAMLQIENKPEDPALIETAFRAMHSLKGGGAMFGFDTISQVTHDLETSFDLIRLGKTKVTSGIVSLTLKVVDFVKDVLNGEETDSAVFESLLAEVRNATDKLPDADTPGTGGLLSDAQTPTYYIKIMPEPDFMDNGSNPMLLLDELCGMGQAFVYADTQAMPQWGDFDVTKCYIAWSVIISGQISENDLSDVFLFVEDRCRLEITKISNENLLDQQWAEDALRNVVADRKELSLENARYALMLGTEASKTVLQKESAAAEMRADKSKNAISSIRVASEKIDLLMNLVSELVTTQARLSLFAENAGMAELSAIAENIQKLSRELRDNAFSIVLIPIESIIIRFQRLVRDLGASLGKDIRFESFGGETELDKTIIENLSDPLMHIIRNSIDHGIEPEAERIAAGKPAHGNIKFRAYHSGPNVFIQIEDDGRGLDSEKIRHKAIEKNLISADTVMSERDIFDLIFLPGFSTAETVSDISGRGVGMDVVRKKISSIRGEIDIDSAKGKGTKMTIKLPLTLSIIDGLLVTVAGTYFVFPLGAIHKILSLADCPVNFGNLAAVDGEQIPFFDLIDEFGLGNSEHQNRELVIVASEDRTIGFAVDSVLGEYQAVLKPLGKHYKDQEVISGATILGDGTIALVIDTGKAIKFFASKAALTEA